MAQTTSDQGVDFVLEQIEKMVASEGGSLDVVSLGEGSLTIKYTPGVNEECPECVPTHEMVTQFLKASLGIHAPYVSDVVVE